MNKKYFFTAMVLLLMVILCSCGKTYECASCGKTTSKAYYTLANRKDSVWCEDCAQIGRGADYEDYRVR